MDRTRKIFNMNFERRNRRLGTTFWGVAAAFFMLSGCGSDAPKQAAEAGPVEDLAPWNSGRRPARAPAPKRTAAQADSAPVVLGALEPEVAPVAAATDRAGLWSIFIAGYRGDDAAMKAQQLVDQLRSGGLAGVYAEQREATWVVAYGGYRSPTDEAARADLEAVRSLAVDGTQPFAGAILTPPKVLGGSMPEYDLSLVRKREGGSRAKYTLQVAQYCRPDRSQPSEEDLLEFRKAAEAACLTLRREGEDAFFYHGPRMSLVTVGLFTEGDYTTTSSTNQQGGLVVSRKPIESAALKLAREKFPYNLINGQAAKFRERPGAEGRVIPSTVVAIPDSK